MSTRCNIIIREFNNEKIIYHHCDGYPEGVGYELHKEIIPNFFYKCNQDNKKFIDIHDLYNFILEYSNEYEEDFSIAGDIDYLYILDIDTPTTITYSCYQVPACQEYNIKSCNNCKLVEQFILYFISKENKNNEEKIHTAILNNPDEEDTEKAVEVMDDAKTVLDYINSRNTVIDNVVCELFREQNCKTFEKEDIENLLKKVYDYAISDIKLKLSLK